MNMCPYQSMGNGICKTCPAGDAYPGCARYKYANVQGVRGLPDYIGILDHGRVLELVNNSLRYG